MNQGDVYWYEFRPPDKPRPVLVLTRDSAIHYLTAITIAPITTTVREIPSELPLSEEDGLLRDCAANFDYLQTVPKARLERFITRLSPARMREARAAIEFALGFDALG